MLAPRMSLDSLLATRQQQQGWAPGAPPSTTTAAAALAAASANSALPLNEQPFPSGNAPRMSNAGTRLAAWGKFATSRDVRTTAACPLLASRPVCLACRYERQSLRSRRSSSPLSAVARKLGLAPQRTSLDARLSKLRGGGVATPPRTSIDGILHALQQSSARSSLDHQQQALLQQAMSGQQQLAMSGERSRASLAWSPCWV